MKSRSFAGFCCWALLTAAGCSFGVEPLTPLQGDNPDLTDSRTGDDLAVGDLATTGGDMASLAGADMTQFNVAPSHVAPSTLGAGSGALAGVATIDTTALALLDGTGTPLNPPGVVFAHDGNNYAVLSLGTWRPVDPVRVVGTSALVVVATGPVSIEANIDGSAHIVSVAAAKTVTPGPGGAAANAGSGKGSVGTNNFNDDTGGSGAGFGSIGGAGGSSSSQTGPGGGVTYGALVTTFAGGSGGGDGSGASSCAGGAGGGGAGGGAIQITSAISVTVTGAGSINVGGSGGRGGCNSVASAGGGGGSGGTIFLEAPTVTVQGILAANGGGGGGGAQGGLGAADGTDGEDGHGSAAIAMGGPGSNGSNFGGAGAAGTTAAAGGGTSTNGGGGGGGVGRVWLRVRGSASSLSTVGSTMSPPPATDTGL